MARRKRGTAARQERITTAPAEAAEAARKPSKAPLIAPFYVAVDRQLKSAHETYEAAEKAALAIKKRHPRLQVTVYEAKAHQHTVIEQPKPAAAGNDKLASVGARNARNRGSASAAGAKH